MVAVTSGCLAIFVGFGVDGIYLESVDDHVHDGINLRCQL